ncbi:hypothetical protein PA598K_01327 [Paenibacillus sp. 598K]|uniref:pyocin knob domain-containing protein n=1 Tax=Paenibacillus sp. 598K TaxID=1117987 RepID=UPI000FF9BE20|nr:pyocin knob domain-containing protein [Paenibacillus sp. 598K]GBF73042.1 hypothetical protein PA598K_01327 [Paenibacillus sp. 598K]
MAFDQQPPEWQAEGIEPPASKRTEGWQVNDKPPAAWLNWFFNKVWRSIKELQTKAVEKVDGKQLSTEDYTTAEKTKLGGIAAGANNYTHPATHPASMIVQDASNRFATDAEKSTWNTAAGRVNQDVRTSANPTFAAATIGRTVLRPANEGESLLLKGGTANHVYLGFYPLASDQNTRGAYFGYVGGGSRTFTFHNQLDDGDLVFGVGGTGKIKLGTNWRSSTEVSGQLISTIDSSYPPFVIASPTLVTNLNVDMLDGYHAANNSTANTVAARTASGNIVAKAYYSDVAQGTAPLNVLSSTLVGNLNADLLDGLHAVSGASAGNTVVARNAAGDVHANSYASSVATGTPPLYVNSTTVVANLNADMVDGYHVSESATASTLMARNTNGDVWARRFTSSIATGTSPFAVSSTTVVTNLNADMLDGYHASSAKDGNTVARRNDDGDLFARTYSSSRTGTSGGALHQILRNSDDALRWGIGFQNEETGSNAGSDFAVYHYGDNGTAGRALTITRSNGNAAFAGSITAANINQDVRSGASPTFAGLNLNAATGGYNQRVPNNSGTPGSWARGASFLEDTTGTRIAGVGLFGTGESTQRLYLGYGASPWSTSNGIHILPNGRLGVRKISPQHELDVEGNAGATRFISSQATGQAPLVVVSTTLVSNLNADMLDGYHATDFIMRPQAIAANTDLNNITTAGFYHCGASATAQTLTNCPTNYAFSLFVEIHAGSKQTLTEYQINNARTWTRNRYGSDWGAWFRVWDARAMGSGSGLDADTVDGYHINQDLRTTASPSFAGLTVASITSAGTVGNWGIAPDGNEQFFTRAGASYIRSRSSSGYLNFATGGASLNDGAAALRLAPNNDAFFTGTISAPALTITGSGAPFTVSSTTLVSKAGNIVEYNVASASTDATALTYTPTTQGNRLVNVYVRVTATTVLKVAVTYTDSGGAQTTFIVDTKSFATGSYSLVPVFINTTAAAIRVIVNSSVAGAVKVSASILEV